MLTRKYFSCPPTVKNFKNKNLTSDFTHQFVIDQVNFCDLGHVFCVCKQTPVKWFEAEITETFQRVKQLTILLLFSQICSLFTR